MKYPDCRIQVFARAPLPGRVMTRLQDLLGPDGCAALHARLVRLTLDKLVHADLAPLELWCSPDCRHVFFDACRQDYPLSLHAQTGEDLGLRMYHAIRHSLAYCDAVVLTGTDCPSLSAADLDEACSELRTGTDIVLGPASDGGYYLVGMRSAGPEVFAGIAWGGGEVLAQSLDRVCAQGLKVRLLTRRDDLDTPADYRRLAQLIETAEADLSGLATRRNLASPRQSN